MLELNKIYNMDCLEGMKQIPDNSVDLILTDPPYGISFLSNRTTHQKEIVNDKFEDWDKNVDLWLDEWYRLLTPTGCCCCCCCGGGGGKTPVSQIFTLKALKKGFKLIQTVIWDKKTIGLGWHYRPSYETIVILSKTDKDYNFYSNSADISNIIRINNIIPQKGDHPTPKPEKLMRFFIKLHSKEENLVLDSFMGSGTTAVVCNQLNRKFIGFEINKEYCDIANERLKQSNLLNILENNTPPSLHRENLDTN